MTRKETYKKKTRYSLKILIGVLFLTGAILGNIGIAFADQDVSSLLTNWFSKKGQESINAIEATITSEKEAQKLRLKEELQSELSEASKKLNQFTEEEKQKRIENLRQHADQLINDMNIDTQEEEQRISTLMDQEIEKAVEELNKIEPQVNQ